MHLIGIASSEKDYRLCFFLNKQLQLNLSLSEEKLEVHMNKKEFSISFFKGFNTDFEFFLLENTINGSILFPKFKNINFWLVVVNKTYNKSIEDLEQQINKIDQVIGSFKISDQKILNEVAGWEFS